MSLSDIIEKIRDDSAAQVEETLAEARAATDEKSSEARSRADEIRAAQLAEGEREAESARARTLALARLSARDAVLARKQAAVDQAFDLVDEKLVALNGAKYAALIERLLVERSSGDEEVLPAAADKDVIDAGLIERANRGLADAGKKASLRLDGVTNDIARGFMLRSGRILTDCSLETLVADARQDMEVEVHELLFGGGAGTQRQGEPKSGQKASTRGRGEGTGEAKGSEA